MLHERFTKLKDVLLFRELGASFSLVSEKQKTINNF